MNLKIQMAIAQVITFPVMVIFVILDTLMNGIPDRDRVKFFFTLQDDRVDIAKELPKESDDITGDGKGCYRCKHAEHCEFKQDISCDAFDPDAEIAKKRMEDPDDSVISNKELDAALQEGIDELEGQAFKRDK